MKSKKPRAPSLGSEKGQIQNQAVPVMLEKLMLQRRCVAYVGAGFSMACGMPNWGGLLRELIDYASRITTSSELEDVEQAVKSNSLPMAASLLETILTLPQINDCLAYTFGPGALARASKEQRIQMRLRMKRLVDAPWAGIVTTNYDELIEQALWGQNEGYDWRSSLKINDTGRLCEALAGLPDHGPFFVKLHGSLESDRVVLTTEDYDEKYLRNSRVSTFLQALMLQYHLVFIGCSLEDEIVRIRRRRMGDFGRSIPKAYAIMARDAATEAKMRHLDSTAFIEPIWYELVDGENQHSGMDGRLQQLAAIAKQPKALQNLTRFPSLRERFQNLVPPDKALVVHICKSGRSVGYEELCRQIKNDADLRKKVCSTPEQEIGYRLLYLTITGVLRERKTRRELKYLIPPALRDEDIS